MSRIGVRAWPGTSDKDGSCSFCPRHTDLEKPGVRLHKVLVLQNVNGGFSARICPECQRDLLTDMLAHGVKKRMPQEDEE